MKVAFEAVEVLRKRSPKGKKMLIKDGKVVGLSDECLRTLEAVGVDAAEVSEDVEKVRAGTTYDELLAFCVHGCDDDPKYWIEYCQAVVSEAKSC